MCSELGPVLTGLMVAGRVGAAIAAVALVSALQMLARSSELPVFRTGTSEARRIKLGSPAFPVLPIADRISDTP